jgi:hypothetical protein
MSAKFDFYEVVRVIGGGTEYAEIWGKEGAVLGKAEGEAPDRSWGYAVSIDGICWDIPEEWLESAGRKMLREDFYSRESIRVRVPEDGRGEIVPDDEIDWGS